MTDIPLDLQAIRARCDAATVGPWKAGRGDMATIVDGVDSKWIYAGKLYVAIASGMDIEEWKEVMANAAFIAHARTDIPALLDALAARDAEIARLQKIVAMPKRPEDESYGDELYRKAFGQ